MLKKNIQKWALNKLARRLDKNVKKVHPDMSFEQIS